MYKVYYEDPTVEAGHRFCTVDAEVVKGLLTGNARLTEGGFLKLQDVNSQKVVWVQGSRIIKIEPRLE
ncbi:MAG: hypothetical protein JWN27_1549 [Candidatus Eremiobacteraeota bacterium]|nr:hypothetical protein [Candidatus Eremiobacteraeota bacterium]